MANKLSYQALEKAYLNLQKENKQLLKAYELPQLLLKSTFESNAGMIALSIDNHYNYLYFNDTHKSVMKSIYGVDIALGMNLLDCIYIEEDKVKAKVNYDKALGGHSHSNIEEYGDHTRFYYESFFNPIINDENKVIGATALAIDITSKVNAEQALKLSDAKQNAIMTNIGDVIAIVDARGVLKYKTSNVERLFGWTAEELLNTDAFVNVHPADLVKFQEQVFTIFENDQASGVFEYRYKRKDGKYTWVELNAVNRIKDPTIQGIIINYHDISARKKAEMALEENELLYKSLFENLSNSSSLYEVILDEKGEPFDYRFLAVNPLYEQSLGLKASDLVGNTLLEIFPDTEPLWLAKFKEVCMSGISGSVESYSKEFDMYFEIVAYIPQPGQMAMIGSDITERKKAEITLLENQKVLKSQNEEYVTLNEELNERNKEYTILNEELFKAKINAEESEGQLKRIANNFVDGMIYQVATIDENTRKFNYVSDSVIRLYGCSPEQAKANSDLVYGKLHPDDIKELIHAEKEAIKTMSIFRTECRVINPDGSIRWSYYVSQPRMVNGMVCWDGLEVDITKQKQILNELTAAKEKAEESDKLKNEFLSNMSHEVRTPMNGIIGFAQLLGMSDVDKKTQKYYIDTIQQSSNQLLVIIDNIIEISKLGTKQVKVVEYEVNLNEMLSKLYAIFEIQAKEKSIDLKLNKQWLDADAIILIDEIKLYKILSNLLENAMKFTDKGYVEFGYMHVIDNQMLASSKEVIRFYVKDSGLGIAKEKQESIFVKFSQVNSDLARLYGGLGLGLSIAKENTELLGGKIDLESEEGKGSEFFVTIPLKRV